MSNYLNNESLEKAVVYLSKKDKDLRRLFKSDGVPPLWARRPEFVTLLKIILEQQVSLTSAKAVYKRVGNSINPFTPEHIEELGVNYLRNLGVTRQKSSVKESLMRIKGIGSWTANIYLLMALRRPDIWPSGDIALEKTVRKLKSLAKNSTPERIEKVAAQWQPYRSVAARMLWHHYLSNSNKKD
jgi:DNA-3-methyladenine glycosylase II